MNRAAAMTTAAAVPALASVGMSFGQTVSPAWFSPFFNSAAPVVAIAALAAFGSARRWPSIALAAAAGPHAMASYYGTSALRGFGVNSFWLLFWRTAGVAVGAVMGVAVWALRPANTSRPGPVLQGFAAAVWPGVAIGESAHGLLRVGDSTPMGYWWVESAVAVAVLGAVGIARVRTTLGVAGAITCTALLAATMFVTYARL